MKTLLDILLVSVLEALVWEEDDAQKNVGYKTQIFNHSYIKKKPDIFTESGFLFLEKNEMENEKLKQRRLTLAKESWLENIMRIQKYSRQKAEELFEKIQPLRTPDGSKQ